MDDGEYQSLIKKSVTVGLTPEEDARLDHLVGERVVAAGLITAEGLAAEREALRNDNWFENARRRREARASEEAARRDRARVRAAAARRREMLSRVKPLAEDRFHYGEWIVEELGETPRLITDLL